MIPTDFRVFAASSKYVGCMRRFSTGSLGTKLTLAVNKMYENSNYNLIYIYIFSIPDMMDLRYYPKT